MTKNVPKDAKKFNKNHPENNDKPSRQKNTNPKENKRSKKKPEKIKGDKKTTSARYQGMDKKNR